MKNKDVDQGYAWVILTFCCVIYLMLAGCVKSFGVLYAELLDYYDEGAGNTAWISSVCFFTFHVMGPMANFLGERITFRKVIMIGSCINLVGYTACYFVTRMEMLYFTYGIITGVGYGLIFSPTTTIVTFYFKKRRSFANGLVVSFSGLGSLSFPYCYRLLLDHYGLHGTFLLIGGVSFHICAAALFMRQPFQLIEQTSERCKALTRAKESKLSSFWNDVKTRMFKLYLFRIPKFTIYLLAMCFQASNYVSNLVVIPGQVRSLGLGKDNISLSVSLVGASEIIARILLGWLGDLNILSRVHIFMICSFISGVLPFFLPHLPYLSALLVYSVCVGAFSGSFGSLFGVMIADAVGLKHFSSGFSLTIMALGFSICISQPATGWLEDATQSWGMSFRFIGILGILAFLLLLTEPYITRMWCFDYSSIQIEELEFSSPIEKDDAKNGEIDYPQEATELLSKSDNRTGIIANTLKNDKF